MTDEVVKQRKIEHIQVALGQDISAPQHASWHDIRLIHQALSEVDLEAIDTSRDFLGHRLRYPLLISSLTGGHPDVATINRNLARAAEEFGLAIGVGSQRAAIVNPALSDTYAIVREHAPHAFLIANIGAPQLIAQERHSAFTLEEVERAIAMIDANALVVHMNILQEATQPEGDRRAVGEVAALKTLIQQLHVPVIAKETGAGVCYEQARLLQSCGVSAIDVGGAGGSSMATLESARAQARGDEQAYHIGTLYHDWGIPTPISLIEAGTTGLPIIATGGVRNGLDVARALALGATLVGMGFPFLKAASQSYEAVCELLTRTIAEMKVAMQLSGAASVAQLREVDVVVMGETREWLKMRGFGEVLKGFARRRSSQIKKM